MAAKGDKMFHQAKAIALATLSLGAILAASVSYGATQQDAQPYPRKAVLTDLDSSAQPVSAAQQDLKETILNLGQSFNGDIGIAVKDLQTGHTISYDGNTFFPQQSVSKFWVALTALDRADRDQLDLQAPVTVERKDLTLFHQPIAQQIGPDGYTTTLNELMFRALTQSDNTCNDFILWKAGGPDAVRAFLARKHIDGIRFGPGERILQSRTAGMEWKQSYAYGGAFNAARNAVPAGVRRAAFENYIKDPMDGATPVGVVNALARLKKGELLSPRSTERLLDIMSHTKTGPQRLKGGLAPGWKLSHKTGTGQVLGGTQAGYNDIGIITSPDGRSYAIAVLIRRTSAPLEERMQTMQSTVRAVINYSEGIPQTRYAASKPETPPVNRTASIAATVAALREDGGTQQ
jgi:beta-lactamase class A